MKLKKEKKGIKKNQCADYHFLTILLWNQRICRRHKTMKFQFYPIYLYPDQSIFFLFLANDIRYSVSSTRNSALSASAFEWEWRGARMTWYCFACDMAKWNECCTWFYTSIHHRKFVIWSGKVVLSSEQIRMSKTNVKKKTLQKLKCIEWKHEAWLNVCIWYTQYTSYKRIMRKQKKNRIRSTITEWEKYWQKFQLNTMVNSLRMAGEQCANRTFCAFEERKMCANEQRTNEKPRREQKCCWTVIWAMSESI